MAPSIGKPAAREQTPEVSQAQYVERELMRRAQAGERESYSKLFELCRERIFGMAYTLLHHGPEAEDCVQETFLRGLEKLSSYRGTSSPNAWFAAIALNICRHRFRDAKRDAGRATEAKLESGRPVGRPRTRAVVSRIAQKEHGRLIAIALGALTDSQREVFVLRYEQELSYEEIGGILGMKSGGARALAHRAKAVLREELGAQVWDKAANQFKD